MDVLLCHYYIITRGYLEIDDLYTARKNGAYHYFHGWNWRAYLAYIIGIALNFYGFLSNMGVPAPSGVTKAYYFAYEIGLFTSFGTYWAAMSLPAGSEFSKIEENIAEYAKQAAIKKQPALFPAE